METTDGAIREPWNYLLGVPPIEEYLGFLTQASTDQDFDLAAAATRWRAAAAVFAALLASEAGAADGHPVEAVPAIHSEREAAFLAAREVAASYLTIAPRLAVVPLDGLVVFQRQISLTYATQLQAHIGDWTLESQELFNYCLMLDQPHPPIKLAQVSPNTFVFSSTSTDARFLGARLVDAAAIAGHIPAGRPTSAVVLHVGYGVNALNVLSVNGRLILNNGSHRAYALRAAGATHAIAVVQDLTREEELSIVPLVQQNRGVYLGSPRPPMLRDYFNPQLTEVIEAPRKVRQIRLQFAMEQIDAPG
jgi:hypothetical protein